MLKRILICFVVLFLFKITETFGQFSIQTDYGYSYRIIVPNGVDTGSYASYIQKKRQGTNLNIEAIWYNADDGFGFGYNEFFNSFSAQNIEISQGAIENISGKTTIDYFSIQYHHRKHYNNPRLSGEFTGGFGYIYYSYTGKQDTANFNNTGNTLGFNLGLLLEYNVYKQFSVFGSTKLLVATLSQIKNDGEIKVLTQKESLTHFDLNFGIRFYF